MKLLKKENWWIWLITFIGSFTTSSIVLGSLLDVFDKDKWYGNIKNWLIGTLCFVFPVLIMFLVLQLQITCLTANKLNLKGSEYYMSPYVWLFLIIIPFLGWILFVVMYLYLIIWTLLALKQGKAEKYI